MGLSRRFAAVLVLFAACPTAEAAVLAVTEEPFLKAAVIVSTVDKLEALCESAGGFDKGQAAALDAWKKTHSVDRIRDRLPELARHPVEYRQMEEAADSIVATTAQRKVEPCAAAVAMSRIADAQFATVAPRLVAIPESAPPARAEDAPADADESGGSPSEELLGQIDSFGFSSRATMGAGGFVGLDIFPVVLLRSGDALKDVRGLRFPGGLDAHRQAEPKKWARWRRQDGKIELSTEKGWKPLPFPTTYSRLPDGMKLEGLFRHVGGTGNVAIGGSQSVTAYTQYRFEKDGRVVRGGGAGSTAAAGDTAVTTAGRTAERVGRYRIDGLALQIRYDDGTAEKRILITDPKEPVKVIWLDGTGYVRR